MEYIDIYGIPMSRLVLGCMRISDMTIESVERLVNTALDIGINMFDHADIYGGGKCESIYGELFKRDKSLRDKIVLQTKCGIRNKWYDLSKKHILESVDGALNRLNTDRIDVLLLHRPDALMRGEEVAEAFRLLEESGKVRIFGVSNFSPSQIDYLQDAVHQKLLFNQLQLSPAFCPLITSGMTVNTGLSEACDRTDGALWYCRKNNITIQTYGTMQCSFTDESGFTYYGAFTTDAAKKKYFALNFMLEGLAQKYNTTVDAVALSWILRHPAKMQAIVGTTNINRVKGYKDCCEVPLTEYEWYKIYESAGHPIP